jgi:8-oxo-dGTP pyrophosphatase MutT (NUDIX family)
MSIKVHFPDYYLLLCSEEEYKQLNDAGNLAVIRSDFETAFATIIIDKNEQNTVFISEDIDYLKSVIQKYLLTIEAAGGVVQNDFNEILFIFRRGKWDLPKGKKEEDEEIAVCAEREIEEETGVSHLTLLKKLTETYHVYEERGKKILKISHWFHFNCPGRQNPVPQTEEDITEIKWINKNNLNEQLSNTYDTIREVMTMC